MTIPSTRRAVDHFSSMPGAIAKDKDAIHDRIEETGVVPGYRNWRGGSSLLWTTAASKPQAKAIAWRKNSFLAAGRKHPCRASGETIRQTGQASRSKVG